MHKLIFILLLLASPALAQQSVLQGGTVTPGHVTQWTTAGVVQDGGAADQGTLTSLGITGGGPTFCQNSDQVTNPFVQLCIGSNTTSAAQISVQNFGGAAAQTLCFVVNGSSTCLPLGFPGTFAVSGTAPIVVNPTTGNITCSNFTNSVSGCVPGSGGGTANFMRADGSWAVPSGSGIGTVTSATMAAGAGISVSGTCTITTTGTCTVTNTGGPAGTLTGTTLASNVVTSSLTSVGTLAGLTVTGSLTATGLVTNADLTNASTTVNGQTCTLGSTCTITAAASALTVGSTTISGGTNGRPLYDNSGVLGELTTTGSGTVAVLATSPTLITPTLGVASATTINKVTLTTPATGSTLTIADGKVHVVNNSITLAGTDSTTWTGASTNMTVAALNIADQTLTGGANVTSDNLGTVTTGTTTIDCGANPLQYLTNGGGPWNLAAPSNDGSCMVLITNNGSAGVITPTGFTVGSNTGAALDTTNAHKFTVSIWRINGTAAYTIFAHQ